MKTHKVSRFYAFIVICIISSLACSLGGANGENNSNNNQNTQAINNNEVENSNQEDSSNNQPDPIEESPSPSPVPDTPTPEPTIAHLDFPTGPAAVSSFMTDISTKSLAAERRSVADDYNILLLERPFTKEVMDYVAEIDIIRSEMYVTSPWVYVTIFVEGSQPVDGENYYGVEIDLSLNGRGDVLVYGQSPNNTDWTTDNVFVYKDQNGDNGGPTPMRGDGSIPQLDGYEVLVFDQGIGNDPDTAWIRVNPNNPNQIQIAFKYSIIQNDNEFLWGTWAAGQIFDQSIFDYHDHIEISEAGSPVSNSSEYPIKEISEVDNTCRWGYGFIPTGLEPGACYVPPTATPVPTPTPTLTPEPSSIIGRVFKDINGDGSGGGDPGYPGRQVLLGSGSCNSTGMGASTTTSAGAFAFLTLPAGTYCITLVIVESCSVNATTPKKYTVNLGAGESLFYVFGIFETIC